MGNASNMELQATVAPVQMDQDRQVADKHLSSAKDKEQTSENHPSSAKNREETPENHLISVEDKETALNKRLALDPELAMVINYLCTIRRPIFR